MTLSSRRAYLLGLLAGVHCGFAVTNRLSATIATNTVVTNVFAARWLRGNPELLARLRGNGFETVAALPVPRNLGSPALTNSIARPNLGPAIHEVTHFPPTPNAGEPVQVTARFHDPDGLASTVLKYRVDPLTTFTNLPMRDDGAAGDEVAGDGLFSAVIPGFPAGKLVAFHLEAVDGAAVPLTNRFPREAPYRECLVRFGDPSPGGSFGVYRLWITQSNVNAWTSRSKIDSTPKDLTFAYGTHRVIYNCGGVFSGSDVNSPYFDNPTNVLCGYALEVPGDDRFLGGREIDLDYSGQDASGQREVLVNWLADQAGLPFNHRRYVHLVANGRLATGRPNPANYGENGAVKVYMDAQSPGGDFLEQWYPGRDEGDLYKLAIWRKTYALSLTGEAGSQGATLRLMTNQAGQKNVPAYRWNWRKRAARIANNDWTNFFRLVDAMNTNGPNYIPTVQAAADIEQWGLVLGLEHAVGNKDSYGYEHGQNMFAYKPRNPLLEALDFPWALAPYDVELGLGTPSVSIPATNSVFDQFSDVILEWLWATNAFRRAYWRGFWALVNSPDGPMRPWQVLPVAQATHQALLANNLSVTGYPTVTNWIGQRYASLTNQLAAVRPPFQLLTRSASVTNQATFELSGYAPVEAVWIRTNGSVLPVTWVNATQWVGTVGLSVGANNFTVDGVDRRTNSLPPLAGEDYTDTAVITRH